MAVCLPGGGGLLHYFFFFYLFRRDDIYNKKKSDSPAKLGQEIFLPPPTAHRPPRKVPRYVTVKSTWMAIKCARGRATT